MVTRSPLQRIGQRHVRHSHTGLYGDVHHSTDVYGAVNGGSELAQTLDGVEIVVKLRGTLQRDARRAAHRADKGRAGGLAPSLAGIESSDRPHRFRGGIGSYSAIQPEHRSQAWGGRPDARARCRARFEAITVNSVCPGPIDTGITADIADADKHTFTRRRTALGRHGEAEEVAHGTLNICLPASRYTTGAVLAADGGLLPRNA